MRILYFDCSMGAAGDMLTAALLDCLPEPSAFVEEFNALGIPGVELRIEDTETSGIRGLHVHIFVHGEEEGGHDHGGHEHHGHHHEHGHESREHHGHHHEHGCDDHHHREHVHEHHHGHEHGESHYHSHERGFPEIAALIDTLPLSETVRQNALAVYRSIAEAEARVHNKPLSQVHFHELGSLDALADVTAFCMLIEKLSPDKIFASPVHVGSGQVKCAHGILPVPAPATAELLRGIPSYGGEIQGELCTPTGAALLRRFVQDFIPQPLMAVSSLGYGVGKKVFPRANCLRALLGEAGSSGESILELSCNLDDMTGEAIGFALELLLEHGALDAYTLPIGMKKSRPGVILSCLCKPEDEDRLTDLMLRHTTSLGVRVTSHRRKILPRSFETVETPYGSIRVKTAGGQSKPEYEDLAKIARAENLTLAETAALLLPPDKER